MIPAPIPAPAANERVPVLCDREITVAAEMFKVIDAAFPKDGGFMSYAYALEFVLVRMDRADMLPYLSGIQCSKRRAHYHEKLTRIFRGVKRRNPASFRFDATRLLFQRSPRRFRYDCCPGTNPATGWIHLPAVIGGSGAM